MAQPSANQADLFFSNHPGKVLSDDFQLVLVCWNMKTPENLGSIIRTAANIGVKRILVVEDGESLNKVKLKRVARSALQCVDLECVSINEWKFEFSNDFVAVALETSPQSVNIYQTALPDKMALFLGNEQIGLPDNIILQCTLSVHIPMPGPVKSMNVSHATSVAAFEWMRQKLF